MPWALCTGNQFLSTRNSWGRVDAARLGARVDQFVDPMRIAVVESAVGPAFDRQRRRSRGLVDDFIGGDRGPVRAQDSRVDRTEAVAVVIVDPEEPALILGAEPTTQAEARGRDPARHL